MKIKKAFYIGTKGITDEEALSRIVTVNTISHVVSASVLVIGFVICFNLGTKPIIVIPLFIEFILNLSAVFLNLYKKHIPAALTVYYTQVAALGFFGYYLQQLFQLEFAIVLLIAIIYLIFKGSKLRKIALFWALIDLAVLEIAYYHPPQTTAITDISYNAAYFIHILVVSAVILITILVCRPYLKSNDSQYALRKANHFIKAFTFQVTHDLRTSIDSIYQVTQLLRKEARSNTTLAPIKPLLEVCFTASTDARNTISNVLDFAELEAGKTQITVKEAFEIRPFLEKSIEVHKILAQKRNINIQLYVEMPEVIISDPLNINQILCNLVSNAVKYAFIGTTINIEAQEIEHKKWELKVTNVGNGIKKEKISDIFDPFVTGKTGKTQGTGLGLYIVKNKVACLNGDIQVQTKPGGYTSFTVTLPFVEGEIRNLPKGADQDDALVDFSNVNILMAEDQEYSRFLLFTFLTDMRCRQVTIVNNGLELLQTAQKGYPHDLADIIILDWNMPELSGEATIFQLKNIPELNTIPIIVITGDYNALTIDKILASGADTYLKKPVDHDVLQKKIALHLRKKTVLY
ncbi:hybrid sensor histidine kinase/response regulator [Flavitalea flava]